MSLFESFKGKFLLPGKFEKNQYFIVHSKKQYASLTSACRKSPEDVFGISIWLNARTLNKILKGFGSTLKVTNNLAKCIISAIGSESVFAQIPQTLGKAFFYHATRFDNLKVVSLACLKFEDKSSWLFFKALNLLSNLADLTLYKLQGDLDIFLMLLENLGKRRNARRMTSIDIRLDEESRITTPEIFFLSRLLKLGLTKRLKLVKDLRPEIESGITDLRKSLIRQGSAACEMKGDIMEVEVDMNYVSAFRNDNDPMFMNWFPHAMIRDF